MMAQDGPICGRCNHYGHETHDIDRCPATEALRKPEPVPDPTYRCIHCGQTKHQDDMAFYLAAGREVCTRCLRGGPASEGLGDGAEEILP